MTAPIATLPLLLELCSKVHISCHEPTTPSLLVVLGVVARIDGSLMDLLGCDFSLGWDILVLSDLSF